MNRRQLGVVLLVGIGLGVGAAILIPQLARRYLPEAVVGTRPVVEGTVLDKERTADRLLVTVETTDGAVLITFKKRMPEIDLLVQRGDVITLGLGRYEPFVEDPDVQRVRKPGRTRPPANDAGTVSPDAEPDTAH